MADSTIEVSVDSVTATHDRNGDIKYVDLELTSHTEREFDGSREHRSVITVHYRFGVDDHGIARLWEIGSDDYPSDDNAALGVSLSDLQVFPAAAEILDGFDGIDSVQRPDETVDKIVSLVDTVNYRE